MAPGMLDKQSHPRHPRVAIGIGEINLAADKDLPIIRASPRQDEDRQDDDFKDREKRTWHSASSNRNSKSLLRQSGYSGWTENGYGGWAHQDSNLGPRDYESPALTAEL